MQITIRADEGKWLTDGENYGKTISLAEGISVDRYYEITDEEYEAIKEKQQQEYAGGFPENLGESTEGITNDSTNC